MKRLLPGLLVAATLLPAGARADAESSWTLAVKYLDLAVAAGKPADRGYWDLVRLQKEFQRPHRIVTESKAVCDAADATAWVRDSQAKRAGKKGEILLHICDFALVKSEAELAQTILHEVSHFVAFTSQNAATRLEAVIVYGAGGAPSWSPYYDFWKFDYDQSARSAAYDYFPSIGIDTKAKYLQWKWRYFGLGYAPVDALRRVFARLTGDLATNEQKLAFFDSPDRNGDSIRDLAKKNGAAEALAELEQIRAELAD